MSYKPVKLNDIPPVISFEEVPKKILVTNQGKRKLVIPPEESGWSKKQVFTSKCLPYEIPYEFIRFVKFPDGSVYPKYKANVVTKTSLKSFWTFGG